jgi:hypothetical protein
MGLPVDTLMSSVWLPEVNDIRSPPAYLPDRFGLITG